MSESGVGYLDVILDISILCYSFRFKMQWLAVIDLHGLSAAGAGGDVAIVEAHQGNIERKGQFDPIPLLAQKIVVTQRVKEQIGKPAPRRAQQPPGIQREEGLPGVFQVVVAKGQGADQGDGGGDEKKVDELADAGLHAGLLSA